MRGTGEKVLHYRGMAQRHDLVELAHAFGKPENDLCILAEGNVSCKGEHGTLIIKGSGVGLEHITSGGLIEVSCKPVLEALDHPPGDEQAVRQILNSARTDPAARHVPSTEAFMHAWLLDLPGVQFVGHGHPSALLSILALDSAEELASKRLFPDEIVCCGSAACYVGYHPPGLPLAIAIRTAVEDFVIKREQTPKTIWLQNHGLICLGASVPEVMCAALMSVKAARVLLGALQSGNVRFLTEAEVRQISDWPDEHYRQRLLSAAQTSGSATVR